MITPLKSIDVVFSTTVPEGQYRQVPELPMSYVVGCLASAVGMDKVIRALFGGGLPQGKLHYEGQMEEGTERPSAGLRNI